MKSNLVRIISVFLIIFVLTACTENSAEKMSADNSAEFEELQYIDVVLEGGSGKAGVESPVQVKKENGTLTASICWSSPYYDYMIVDGSTYYPVNNGGNSVFEIPIPNTSCSLSVQADTVAMSEPHLIDYILIFGESGSTVTENSSGQQNITLDLSDYHKTGELNLDYAAEFSVDYYEEGFSVIRICGENPLILVSEEGMIPENLDENVQVIQQPLQNIYLVSSSAMDMFDACESMDTLKFCALQQEEWHLDSAVDAMTSGSLIYAGKYSAPDYELLCSEGCDLAIENTMILHTPDVVEQLQNLNIPVLIDHSSYEDTPQGRMEWIKLYGYMTDHLEEAADAFNQQIQLFKEAQYAEDIEKTVAFFYVTENGQVSVRNASDYLSDMIELAGGNYLFSDIGIDSSNSTTTIQLEEFYSRAKDADILIYNSTIAGGLKSLNDFIAINPLFSNLKAVKNHQVYCTSQNLYQSSMELGTFEEDLLHLFHENTDSMTFLYQLEE